MKRNEKPPIGLKPRFIVEEERLKEVRSAIRRYSKKWLRIPNDWIYEYNELITKMIKR